MKLKRSYHFLIGCFAFLFVTLQGSALAHAAQYGDNTHEHNGVVCTVDAIAAEQDVSLPVPVSFNIPAPALAQLYAQAYVSAAVTSPQGRAPPPRGPPTLS